MLRRQIFYPPYSHLVKLLYQHEEGQTARDEAARLIAAFQQRFRGESNQQTIGSHNYQN